jgi:hypothetical protein
MAEEKLQFEGALTSIQPRIRLNRSFDESWHSYLGYALTIASSDGSSVSVGISEKLHEKHRLHSGMVVSLSCKAVEDPRLESVEFYRVTGFKVLGQGEAELASPLPPSLAVYRERGPRRLSAKTYEGVCASCIWGCKMAVEITVDQWKPWIRKYRVETFCYGPKSCKHYRPGPNRKVSGRNGMVYVEEDWVDEMLTQNRGDDE